MKKAPKPISRSMRRGFASVPAYSGLSFRRRARLRLLLERAILLMMIGGRKRLYYSYNILIRAEPGLRAAVAEAAAREKTTMSEIIRRGLRAAIIMTAQQTSWNAAS